MAKDDRWRERMERKEVKRLGLKMLEPRVKALKPRIADAEPVREPRKGKKTEPR